MAASERPSTRERPEGWGYWEICGKDRDPCVDDRVRGVLTDYLIGWCTISVESRHGLQFSVVLDGIGEIPRTVSTVVKLLNSAEW